MLKIENFTSGQKELLRDLAHGCNIALYREGLVRLRDANHNPIKTLRKDMFDKVKEFVEKRESGLWYFNEAKRDIIPKSILI